MDQFKKTDEVESGIHISRLYGKWMIVEIVNWKS